jgi:tubby-related protein 1
MMTVGIDNPAFEDFLDSEDERVDENSNELNSAEKKTQFLARQDSAENETAKNDDSESEEEAQEADFGSQDPKVVQLNPAGKEIVKCRITRDRKGIEAFGYPTYFLFLDSSTESETSMKDMVLCARKRKTGNSSYIIATSLENLNSEIFVGKLKSNNLIGTRFTCYDHGRKPEATDMLRREKDENLRSEMVSILYDQNVLGFKGPRKMTVVLPKMDEETKKAITVKPAQASQTLLGYFDEADLTHITVHHNRQPNWNEKTQSYVLNFNGRVTQASVKNFQITESDNPQSTIMQFGRIRNDNFTMDYRYPLSAVQAFGIALSSFDPKLACE